MSTILTALLAGCGAPGDRAPSLAATDAAEACPYRTAEQWQQFLERAADDPGWGATCENGPCPPAPYERIEAGVQSVFARCGGFLAGHPRIARCAENLRQFTPTWLAQHSPDTYGFTVDNATYLAAQEGKDRPEGMMRPPDALLAALPLRARVESAARAHGWKYLTHDSALGGIRTFVLVPDPKGRFDQWMLLNFTGRDQPTIDTETPMSFIAVEKRDRDGHALSRVRLHFRDYALEGEEGRYALDLLESRNGKCYACHVSGMRQLLPRRTATLDARPGKGDRPERGRGNHGTSDFAWGRLQELNATLRSYGMPDWEGLIEPEHHGPALGQAEGCTDCHDGHTRGVLRVTTSTSQLERKIREELSMPPARGVGELLDRSEGRSPGLSPEDRRELDRTHEAHEELFRQFQSSRLPTLKRWLLEAPCR